MCVLRLESSVFLFYISCVLDLRDMNFLIIKENSMTFQQPITPIHSGHNMSTVVALVKKRKPGTQGCIRFVPNRFPS